LKKDKFPPWLVSNPADPEPLDDAMVLSDWLALVREAAFSDDHISDETRAELAEHLALAEAALRRAHAERSRD
jgi:hypothetical protein